MAERGRPTDMALSYGEFLSIKLEDLDLPSRWTCLASNGFDTIGSIISQRDDILLRIPNLGRKTLREVRSAIKQAAAALGVSDPDQDDGAIAFINWCLRNRAWLEAVRDARP